MNHLRLLVALAAIAFGTAAMACDGDEDAAPPDRANVVQAMQDGGTQGAGTQGAGTQGAGTQLA